MSGFDGFVGNERLLCRLKSAIASRTLTHAMIIEGGAGTGKSMLADLICCALSCKCDDAPCMDCIACRKIIKHISPDVKYIEPEKGKVQLGVDVIRNMRDDTVFSPNELENKFYVFPDAGAMNPQAQNALLKVLEEPPEYVIFILLCDNADKLLTTVRSRAPLFRLEALSDETVRKYLLDKEPKAQKLAKDDSIGFDIIIKSAHGSIGAALDLLDTQKSAKCKEKYEKAEKYLTFLANGKSGRAELEFFEFATSLVTDKKRDELSEIYRLLGTAVNDLLAVKLSKTASTSFFAQNAKAEELSEAFPTAKLLALAGLFSQAAEKASGNANLNILQTQTAIGSMGA